EPAALVEEGVPALVRAIPDPPLVLYRRGPGGAALRDGRAVAVVGARRATDYGRYMAARLGAEVAAVGVSVVSGAARGVDAAAHPERPGDPIAARVLACLRPDETRDLDGLSAESGIELPALLQALLQLELSGAAERREGSRYIRKAVTRPARCGHGTA